MTITKKIDTGSKAAAMIEAAAELEATRFIEEYEHLRQYCESPIEELLLAGLYADHRISAFTQIVFLGCPETYDPFTSRHVQSETFYIYQQAKVGPYRVDFLIQDASVPTEIQAPRWMVVECDGHDYHERTKEQARRDKKRDRYFQSRGLKVLRFTGSEIFADPQGCAEEVLDQRASEDKWRNREK
jgi:very-short-patch-repair endonuclease